MFTDKGHHSTCNSLFWLDPIFYRKFHVWNWIKNDVLYRKSKCTYCNLKCTRLQIFQKAEDFPTVDLHLNFEIPSLKNQVRQTWFFLSISHFIFAGYTGSKNKFEIDKISTSKVLFKNQFHELQISKIRYR